MGKMKCVLLGACLFSLFIGVCEAAGNAQKTAGEVLVVLKNELKEPLTAQVVMSVEGRLYVARVAQSVEARVAHTYDALSEAGGTIFSLFVSEKKTTEQLLEALKTRPEVLAASPNHEVRLALPPKPSAPAPKDEGAKPKPDGAKPKLEGVKPKPDGTKTSPPKKQESKS